MGAYAQSTFKATVQLAFLLGAWIALAVGLVALLNRLHPSFQSFLLGWIGILFSIVAGTVYAMARKVVVRG